MQNTVELLQYCLKCTIDDIIQANGDTLKNPEEKT